jgi:CRP/FNR family transcriptional regulator, cyclic AMP receptor protein
MRQEAHREYDINSLLSAVQSKNNTIRYRKRDVIFSQGEASDAMYYIVSGALKLTVVSAEGKEVVICIASGGTLIGESSISSGRPVRFHSAVALTVSHLVKIDRTAILRVLRQGGEESIDLISFLFKQNARLQQDLAGRLVGSTEQNLAHLFSSLAHLRGDQGSEPLPHITQQTIAEMMGISRQRVNVLMNRVGLARRSSSSRAKATFRSERRAGTNRGTVHSTAETSK